MQPNSSAWTVFEADTPVLTYTYSFGPGMANALAVGGADGLIVLSPPYRAREEVFDALETYGPVRALIASNAFHHMGIPAWKQRFPEAAVFAPSQSIPRVERKTRLSGVRPLAEAKALAGQKVELVDMPHYRTGETLVRLRTTRGLAWYVTDIMMNWTELPKNPVINVLFRLGQYGPGLRFNRVAPLFMVSDKVALKRWLALQYEKEPPQWLIPTHGEVFDFGAHPEAARALFSV